MKGKTTNVSSAYGCIDWVDIQNCCNRLFYQLGIKCSVLPRRNQVMRITRCCRTQVKCVGVAHMQRMWRVGLYFKCLPLLAHGRVNTGAMYFE